MDKTVGLCLVAVGMVMNAMADGVSAGDCCRCKRRAVVCVQCSSGRSIAAPASGNRGLDGVEQVLHDMMSARPSTGGRALSASTSATYMQDLESRLIRLESRNGIQPTQTRALGLAGGIGLLDIALGSAADILGALRLKTGASDQDKAEAIIQALIPKLQQIQQSAQAVAPAGGNVAAGNAAIAGLTPGDLQLTLALAEFKKAVDASTADAAKRAEFQVAQKKALEDLIKALAELSKSK